MPRAWRFLFLLFHHIRSAQFNSNSAYSRPALRPAPFIRSRALAVDSNLFGHILARDPPIQLPQTRDCRCRSYHETTDWQNTIYYLVFSLQLWITLFPFFSPLLRPVSICSSNTEESIDAEPHSSLIKQTHFQQLALKQIFLG